MNDIKKELMKISKNLSLPYVEDEEETRTQYGSVFKLLFKEVDVAQNGEDALSKYNQKQYDLIITDLTMPKMNGIQMIESIIKINPKQHIIIMTAHNTDENLRSSIDFQVDGILLKPVAIDKLFSLLYKVCKLVSMEKQGNKKGKKTLDNILENDNQVLFLAVVNKYEELIKQFGSIVQEPIISAAKEHLSNFGIEEDFYVNLEHGVCVCSVEKIYLDYIISYLQEFSERRNILIVEVSHAKIHINISYGVIVPKQKIDYINNNSKFLFKYI
ncbi:MAG: response regulator, partial [Campylobacterales bacterium]|nr:response regulator [Campylobacterales bacterium]